MARVLIVEDDPGIRGQYAAALTKRGHTVVQARDAEEGLQVLQATPPDLVLLDILMPGTDGIAFLKSADIPHQYPDTKVLVASNVDSNEFAQELDHLKADRYVIKADYTPYTMADLVGELTGDKDKEDK